MDTLGKLLLQLGWPSFLLFIAVALGSYGVVQWISQVKFKNRAEKNGIKVGENSDLRYHILFSAAQYRLTVELPNLEIFPDKPVRQALMTDLLRIYIKHIADGCREMASVDMGNWSAEQWTTEMGNKMNSIICAANSAARDSGIPEIVVTKFTRWINPSIDMLFTYVETVGRSPIYHSNLARTNTLFLVVNLLMSTMLGDAERTIRYLNGDITGKMYRNQMIEPLDH